MIQGWIGFACGLVIGVAVGVFIRELCGVVKRGDIDIELMFADVVPADERYRPEDCLKLFCLNDHEWYGECLPAVCPVCCSPAVGARL